MLSFHLLSMCAPLALLVSETLGTAQEFCVPSTALALAGGSISYIFWSLQQVISNPWIRQDRVERILLLGPR